MKTKLSLATVFIAAICIVFSFSGCNNAKSVEPADLSGYWVLKTMNGKDAKNLFSGALPTLMFDFSSMQISGTGGCNRYNGAFTYENNVLKAPNIVATQMLCFDENAEPQFLIEMAKDNHLSLENGTLTFMNRDKEVVFEFEKGEAADETPANVTGEMLNGKWVLTRMEGAEASYIFQGENANIPTMEINAGENSIHGNAGCNTYNARFSLDDNTFIMIMPVMTQMACPNLEGEGKYIRNLQDTLVASLPNPDVLLFMKDDQAVLEFEKEN